MPFSTFQEAALTLPAVIFVPGHVDDSDEIANPMSLVLQLIFEWRFPNLTGYTVMSLGKTVDRKRKFIATIFASNPSLVKRLVPLDSNSVLTLPALAVTLSTLTLSRPESGPVKGYLLLFNKQLSHCPEKSFEHTSPAFKPEHDWTESADGGNEDTGANHSEPDGNGDEVGTHNPGKGAEEEEDSHIDPAGYRSGFFAVARHLQKVWGVEGDLQMPPEEQDEYGLFPRQTSQTTMGQTMTTTSTTALQN
ncbi:hypothetical protein B0H14DRAFT_3135739 [Mycena olivaceomarginata]|nr:hypothetical protein B0H14DRAFT_3135739 [Mycena olivaceomarginata]